jgi:hypothetical protein
VPEFKRHLRNQTFIAYSFDKEYEWQFWILFVDFFSQSETFNGRDVFQVLFFFCKYKTIVTAIPAIFFLKSRVSFGRQFFLFFMFNFLFVK